MLPQDAASLNVSCIAVYCSVQFLAIYLDFTCSMFLKPIAIVITHLGRVVQSFAVLSMSNLKLHKT